MECNTTFGHQTNVLYQGFIPKISRTVSPNKKAYIIALSYHYIWVCDIQLCYGINLLIEHYKTPHWLKEYYSQSDWDTKFTQGK